LEERRALPSQRSEATSLALERTLHIGRRFFLPHGEEAFPAPGSEGVPKGIPSTRESI